MKKKGLFSKILVGLLAFGGIFMVASCETTEHNANIPCRDASVVISKVGEGETLRKFVEFYIPVSNPTIYNATAATVTYMLEGTNHVELGEVTFENVQIFVRHGVAGYMYEKDEITNPTYKESVEYARLIDAKITSYQNVWETYIAPFIVAIVIVSLDIIFFALELFRKGWTKEYLKERMREKMASSLVILGLVILICFIPLMFANWVTTVILFGAFAAALLIDGALTAIKIATVKK